MIKKLSNLDSLAVGLAMFSMFFGAGNVIFPLALGQYAGDKIGVAIWGLILSAALMPIAGVIAMFLFDGNYRQFFGRLGKTPGFILAFIIIALLGPLGSTPRCIALGYTTLKSSFPWLNFPFFSAFACAAIFLFAFRKNRILTLLGWVLTPLLLASLTAIIVIGFFAPTEANAIDQGKWSIFVHGLKEGYNTMDLLAAFFFSSTILQLLKMKQNKEGSPLKTAIYASAVGALLLGLVYVGFCYLASFHAAEISVETPDQLLAAIILKVAGSRAGFLVCITVALACLTTAIALISAFADFCHKEVFKEKMRYEMVLALSLAATFVVSTFKFTGIAAFLGPVLEICYPGLIVLTFLNIAHKLKNIQFIKIPVFFTFTLSALFYFSNMI